MYALNDNEEKIIGTFGKNQCKFDDTKMTLKWKDGSEIIAIYRNYLEDDMELDDGTDEELWSFLFEVIDVNGTPPVYITEHNLFIVNYHNFPDEIIADGKKIN